MEYREMLDRDVISAIERAVLMEAIAKIENMAGNETYKQAWRRTVEMLREMVLTRCERDMK